MDPVQAVARDWLSLADDLGWGVEGPANATEVARTVREVAAGQPPTSPGHVAEDRDLGLRPVDALFEAASLVVEASLTGSTTRRDELLSAARGWLRIASGG